MAHTACAHSQYIVQNTKWNFWVNFSYVVQTIYRPERVYCCVGDGMRVYVNQLHVFGLDWDKHKHTRRTTKRRSTVGHKHTIAIRRCRFGSYATRVFYDVFIRKLDVPQDPAEQFQTYSTRRVHNNVIKQ